MERSFKWPSSESKGKRWLLDLCLNQVIKRDGKIIGRKISNANWLQVKMDAGYEVLTRSEVNNSLTLEDDNTYLLDSRNKTQDNPNMTCISVGEQNMSLCRKVDRLLFLMKG